MQEARKHGVERGPTELLHKGGSLSMLEVRRWTEAGVTTLRCTRAEKPHKATSLSGRWMRAGCGMHNGNILALESPRTLRMLARVDEDCTFSVTRISLTSAWVANVTSRLQTQLADPG